MHFDLCLPWYWEYDIDFVHFVEHACKERVSASGRSRLITCLNPSPPYIKARGPSTHLLDRSQGDDRFLPIHRWAKEYNKKRINPTEVSIWSEDKATMHLELITAGINTPYTILLSPFLEQADPSAQWISLRLEINSSSSHPTKAAEKASFSAHSPSIRSCAPACNFPNRNICFNPRSPLAPFRDDPPGSAYSILSAKPIRAGGIH